MEVKSNSPKTTEKIAQNLAKTLKKGDVVALFGDLGAGKTTFVQGLARGLGTMNLGPQSRQTGRGPHGTVYQPLTFYHIDLYRGEDINDFKALGLDEIFQEDAIIVLEWAEKIKDKLPKKRIDVEIKVENGRTRKINIDRRS